MDRRDAFGLHQPDIAIRLSKVLYSYPGASLAVVVLTYASPPWRQPSAGAAERRRAGRGDGCKGEDANATLSIVAVVLLVVLVVGVSALIDYLVLGKDAIARQLRGCRSILAARRQEISCSRWSPSCSSG